MIEELLNEVYTKFKLNFYRLIFKNFEKREATLTTMETFCVETIHALKTPTVNRFAEFLNISQANAAYKVAKLAEKGYINRIQSKTDKREFHLTVTDKFMDYYNISQSYVKTVAERINERFSEKDLKKLSQLLQTISLELMPEVALNSSN
jgi:DNA-binding MarR family transcriptional regulator